MNAANSKYKVEVTRTSNANDGGVIELYGHPLAVMGKAIQLMSLTLMVHKRCKRAKYEDRPSRRYYDSKLFSHAQVKNAVIRQ
jgi:hypothetical protein